MKQVGLSYSLSYSLSYGLSYSLSYSLSYGLSYSLSYGLSNTDCPYTYPTVIIILRNTIRPEIPLYKKSQGSHTLCLSEWLSGCAVITSEEYDPDMGNPGTDIFQTTASDVVGALEDTLCNVPANINIRILDIMWVRLNNDMDASIMLTIRL